MKLHFGSNIIGTACQHLVHASKFIKTRCKDSFIEKELGGGAGLELPVYQETQPRETPWQKMHKKQFNKLCQPEKTLND